MTNPATTLLALFEKWNGASSQAPYNIRGFHSEPVAAWEDHEEAIKAIADMSRMLDRLEQQGQNVRSMRSGITLSMKALLNFPHSWQQAGSADATITQHLVDVLGVLEPYLDSQTMTLHGADVATIEDLLAQVITGLDNDPNLSAQLKSHILRVVQTIRSCIEEYGLTGSTDLGKALHDLWIALYAAAGATTEDRRGFWQNLVDNIGYPAAGSALGSLPSVISTLMLGQG